MTNYPIVDAHVHLWDPHAIPVPWLGDVPLLNRLLSLAQYVEDCAGTNVEGFVVVEADVAPQCALLEARHLVELAEQTPALMGLVAAAPLEYGDRCRTYLDALHSLGDRIKGVRRILQDEPQRDLCLHDEFVAGVQLLAEYDWTFDMCIRHDQLLVVTELVRRCPKVRFVLDHLAKPPISTHQFDPWRAHISALAQLPNVWCKLSGIVTEAQQDWRVEHLLPYVMHALTVFGPDRVLFGGDWPVVRLASSYGQWIAAVQDMLSAYSPSVQRQVLGMSARNAYHLVAA